MTDAGTVKTLRTIALTAATMYLGLGLFLGAAMAAHIPAMNARCVAYYAAVWPGFILAGTVGTPTPPVPFWCFTFAKSGGQS